MAAKMKSNGILETPEEQKAREDKESQGSPLTQQLAMIADPNSSNAQKVGAIGGTLLSALIGKKKEDEEE